MRNRLLNKRYVELSAYLKEQGFESCILKGQGNALMYPAIHYRPSYRCRFLGNNRLQKWMTENEETQFGHETLLPEGEGKIVVPTWEFNVVFQLCHICSHMMFEGIGLRQIIDYYYLLKSNTDSMDYAVFDKTLRYLGLMEMAGAMMWVMREVLGLEEKYLIAPVDERRGSSYMKR